MPGVVDGSLLAVSHAVFDLGEGLLDRIEIRRVRRQVPQRCAGNVDEAAQRGRSQPVQLIREQLWVWQRLPKADLGLPRQPLGAKAVLRSHKLI